jgi:hypothetical protein
MSQRYKATEINTNKERYFRAEYEANGSWYWVDNAWGQTCKFSRKEDALHAAAKAIGINYPSAEAQDYYDYKDRN